MAIELNPQKRSRTSLMTTIVAIIAVFLVLAFAGSYLYFYITTNNFVKRINQIQEDSKDIDNSIKSKENELLVFEKRINDFSSLILGHKNVASIFNFLDDNTIPAVWFKELSYEEEKGGTFLLMGESDSFFLIEQQIVVFRNQELIKEAKLTEISVNEESGLIEFSISVAMDESAFVFKEETEPLLEVETPVQ